MEDTDLHVGERRNSGLPAQTLFPPHILPGVFFRALSSSAERTKVGEGTGEEDEELPATASQTLFPPWKIPPFLRSVRNVIIHTVHFLSLNSFNLSLKHTEALFILQWVRKPDDLAPSHVHRRAVVGTGGDRGSRRHPRTGGERGWSLSLGSELVSSTGLTGS